MHICKRPLDLFVSAVVLALIWPLLLIVAVLVRTTIGTPVLFRQQRPGLHGKPFTIYKYRTMTNACDANGHLLSDSERLTKLGRFLRSASLDELPELFNVLNGEMSLVGPRPLLVQYLEKYTPEQMRRHEVKPGITGWAQIHGRNATTWEERFDQDIWYVDHCSFATDLLIILKTPFVLLKGDGSIDLSWQLGMYMGPGTEPNHDGRLTDI